MWDNLWLNTQSNPLARGKAGYPIICGVWKAPIVPLFLCNSRNLEEVDIADDAAFFSTSVFQVGPGKTSF